MERGRWCDLCDPSLLGGPGRGVGAREVYSLQPASLLHPCPTGVCPIGSGLVLAAGLITGSFSSLQGCRRYWGPASNS